MQPIMNPAVLLLLLLSTHYLISIGIVVRTNSLGEAKGWLLVATAALSFLGTAGQAVLLATRGGVLHAILERMLLYGVPFLMVAFLGLTRAFLRLKGVKLVWVGAAGGWLLALLLLHGDLVSLPERGWLGLTAFLQSPIPTNIALGVGWAAFLGRSGFLTLRAFRQTECPLHRNRLRFWFLTVGMSVLAAGFIFGGRYLSATVFHLVGMVVASYVIMTHDLPDILHTARGALSYALVTLVIGEFYTAAFLLVRAFLGPFPENNAVMAAVVASLALAAFIGPLLKGTRWLADELISGRTYDASGIIREYSVRISNILDLEELASVAVGLVADTMHARRGALLVVQDLPQDGEGEGAGEPRVRLRGIMGLGEGPVPPHTLSREGAIVGWVNHEHRPLTQYDVDLLPRFEDLPPDDRYWLDRLGMDVFLPIQAKDEWIGLLAVGPKASGERYFEEDLALLGTLADQTAVALENARLFEDLKRQNRENERLNEELLGANREMARLDQLKSNFIDIASHELRTPLTQVRGYNDILDEMLETGSLTPEAGLTMTAAVRKAAKRLEEIVDTMFDVSQLHSDSMDLVKTPVEIEMIMENVLREWERAIRERHLSVKTLNLRTLPTIMADSQGLSKVFSHLIQNAVKYTPDGGSIRIQGWALGLEGPADQQAVEIVVADSGIGIEPEDQDLIFETFYRASDVKEHSSGKTKFKGAGPGLGLTIARGIVLAHGGRIWAESPGCDEETCPGSEFHVLLPVGRSPSHH